MQTFCHLHNYTQLECKKAAALAKFVVAAHFRPTFRQHASSFGDVRPIELTVNKSVGQQLGRARCTKKREARGCDRHTKEEQSRIFYLRRPSGAWPRETTRSFLHERRRTALSGILLACVVCATGCSFLPSTSSAKR